MFAARGVGAAGQRIRAAHQIPVDHNVAVGIARSICALFCPPGSTGRAGAPNKKHPRPAPACSSHHRRHEGDTGAPSPPSVTCRSHPCCRGASPTRFSQFTRAPDPPHEQRRPVCRYSCRHCFALSTHFAAAPLETLARLLHFAYHTTHGGSLHWMYPCIFSHRAFSLNPDPPP